jgi:hypothetical protein
MRVRYCIVLGCALSGVGEVARAAVILDFEGAGQYAGNFRKIAGTGNPAQTGPTPDNDYVTMAGTVTATTVYDTTPADATEKSVFTVAPGSPLTFSADARFATATSSFGIYFVDATNEAAGYLALLNFNQTGSNELIRFASNGVPNTGGAGTLITPAGSSADVINTNEFSNILFSYSIDENNHPVLSVTAGSLSSSHTFDAITTPLTNVQVAIRSSPQTVGQNDFDNVIVDAVPEPASLALLACGALAARRRRGARL